MIEIRPIQDGDMAYVRANPLQESVKGYPDLVPSPDSYTCLFDGKIVAVGGVVIYLEGIGEIWLMLTKQAREDGFRGLAAFNTIKKKIEEFIVEHKLRRVEAQVRSDFPEALRMIKALKFNYEGTKKEATPDRVDMQMFARII